MEYNITSNLSNASCIEWDSIIPVFSATFSGSSDTDVAELSAQWFYESSSLNNITASGGTSDAFSSSLTFANNISESIGRYWVVFTSGSDGGITSSIATLTVQSVVKTQPSFASVYNEWDNVGLLVVLTGSAQGTSTFQWQRPVGTNITNATASALTYQMLPTRVNQYRVLIQSASLGKTSSVVSYVGVINPLINTQPTSSVPHGIPFEPLVVGGEIVSSSIAYTYQWYRTGNLVAGATSINYPTTFLFSDPLALTFYVKATTSSGSVQSSDVSIVSNRGGACAEPTLQYRTDLTDGFGGTGVGYVRW